ncbi:hypothetical protein VKT23_012020 [Stygiomarasmius scandens]|uniref:Cytochrome c oxidase subunit 8, mitochondrial n=1 Tax=Marasmiellus scandens TaxID=2682957 RepID=A0ABR1JA92_9AGAR
MSFLARSAKTTARTFRVQARGVHHTEITPIAGGMPSVKGTTHAHSDLSHLPFDYKNKSAFVGKAAAFLGTAFAIPWVAIWWRWHRPGGLKNP